MMSLLDEARHSYDLVVIDTPPLVLLPDAFPLLQHADGVLIVSRLGHGRRELCLRLRAALVSAGALVIGVVANGYKRTRGDSPYGYGYSYKYSGTVSMSDEVAEDNDSPWTAATLPDAFRPDPPSRRDKA